MSAGNDKGGPSTGSLFDQMAAAHGGPGPPRTRWRRNRRRDARQSAVHGEFVNLRTNGSVRAALWAFRMRFSAASHRPRDLGQDARPILTAPLPGPTADPGVIEAGAGTAIPAVNNRPSSRSFLVLTSVCARIYEFAMGRQKIRLALWPNRKKSRPLQKSHRLGVGRSAGV